MSEFSNDPLPDPRVSQADIDMLLGAYRRAVRTKRGEVVLIAGQAGSGRPAILEALAQDLRKERPRPAVIGGQFSDGQYRPRWFEQSLNIPFQEIVAATGAGLAVASGFPAIAFAGQIVQAGAAGWEVIEACRRREQTFPTAAAALKRLLRCVANERPVVCLLDDLDLALGSWWTDFVLDFAPEMAADLRLLLVVMLDEAATVVGQKPDGSPDFGEAQPGEPDHRYMARRLTERELARWAALRPLTFDETARWLGPADPDVARRLHEVTGGSPGWLYELVKEWAKSGVLRRARPNGPWRISIPADTPTLSVVNGIIDAALARLIGPDDRPRRDELKDLLAHAALEGRRFTADALAKARGRDRDDLVDLFDATIVEGDDRPAGLLREAGGVTIHDPRTGPRHLWRYEFVSDLHYLTLHRYGLAGHTKERLAEAKLDLVRALVDLYTPDIHGLAKILARLFVEGGDAKAAAHYHRIAATSGDREALRQQAQTILATPKDDWGRADYIHATVILLNAGRQMRSTYPLDQTLAVFDSAFDLASRAGVPEDVAQAQFGRGAVWIELRDYASARTVLAEALAIFRELRDRGNEADTLRELGVVDMLEGDYPAARRNLGQALDIEREGNRRAGMAATLRELGVIDQREGDRPTARRNLAESLAIKRELGDQNGVATALFELGHIDLLVG